MPPCPLLLHFRFIGFQTVQVDKPHPAVFFTGDQLFTGQITDMVGMVLGFLRRLFNKHQVGQIAAS